MIEADTPNLWEIRANVNHETAIAVIVIALIHTARLVNIENNLNETQIGEIANDILNDYGYLKVEELKHVLKTAVRTQKIFGRLDYNVVMGWFADYDNERTAKAMSISDCEDAKEQPKSTTAISYEEYISRLKALAEQGDTKAIEKLRQIEDSTPSRLTFMTAEDKRQKELDFKQFYHNYIRQKK